MKKPHPAWGWVSPFKIGVDKYYTPEYKDLYAKRKETIERVFADAKEKHAMRYTFFRGLAQVSNWVRLKFAAMNLKKLAFPQGKAFRRGGTGIFFVCVTILPPALS